MKRYDYAIDAAFHYSRDRLAYPVEQKLSWPDSGKVLARSLEYAVSGLGIAWGHPVKAGPKAQRIFDTLGPHTPPALATAVVGIWAAEGQTDAKLPFDQLHALATAAVDSLHKLSNSTPPTDLAVPPSPQPINWEDLDPQDQVLLSTAAAEARKWVPDLQVRLFGSRAAGRARPDSDYDLLLIFPTLPHPQQSLAIGDLTTHVRNHDAEVDRVELSAAAWTQPEPADELIVDLTRQCSIEVPSACS
ncbi:nucleotidyltransferase domain-containing protein [Streptacidiphilus neutrinimicus]|uniref:nucleotidyltransferase domain-containing protein n=1 Tax=Streptacidiphilus neutrinimicus TaxID=105420 RepID=UPI000A002695|nr:nucleotidyltransferase domain-containing protein [Streptacidiphilus neutrinimicus]